MPILLAVPDIAPASAWGGCYAYLEGSCWVVGNAQIERRWTLSRGELFATTFLDKATGRNWFGGTAAIPSMAPPAPSTPTDTRPAVSVSIDGDSCVQAPSLVADLTLSTADGHRVHRFRVFPAGRSVTMQLLSTTPPSMPQAVTAGPSAKLAPTGAEMADTDNTAPALSRDLLDCFRLKPGHFRLLHITLQDQTDAHGNLAVETTYFVNPADRQVRLSGNLFIFEDIFTGGGLILLKHAPLPSARPVRNPFDLDLRSCFEVAFLGHGTTDGQPGYPFALISYQGGRAGRTAALHAYQRQFRLYDPSRDGLLQSNTWGDRSQDGRISDPFIRQEIEAAAKLGVDIVQIDDGWQSGKTVGSVDPTGGVWQGYWAVSKTFWTPHPRRFPDGLKPVVQLARSKGLKFGLWFSPDSADDFSHWQDDAKVILDLHRELDVDFFKIDGVKALTKLGERNLQRFFDTVLTESCGRVTFDLDVTAEVRPGYLGMMQVGPLFVENRYTDTPWRRYYPHHTLRTLWTLAQYLDPLRLRMEFLNNARNTAAYGADPLAPACYRPDHLFATVMFSSPLGWFEVSGLPPSYFAQAAPVIAKWKQHRHEIFAGNILPIGEMPSGASWTGFVSVAGDCAHLLVFREHNAIDTGSFDLPGIPQSWRSTTRLAGDGSTAWEGSTVKVGALAPLRFGWFRITR